MERLTETMNCELGTVNGEPNTISLKRLLKRVILSLQFVVLSFCFAHAETPQDIFKQGNAAYTKGDFSQAITLYESARAKGLRHWAVEFNLGNAYYKANQLGKAIVNYGRAFRLNSGQGDVIYNFNLATTKAGDPLVPASGIAAVGWRFFFLVSLNALTISVSLMLIVLCGASIAYFLGRPVLRLNRAYALGVVFGLVSIWLAGRIYVAEKSEGVIITPVADVRSGPNLTYPANFTIPEGRRIVFLDEQEPVTGWVEIGVPQEGLKGWVPTSSVESI